MITLKQYFEEKQAKTWSWMLKHESWSDDDITITLKEVIEYLDEKKVPVKKVDTDKLKSILIAANRDPKRLEAADVQCPIIVVVDMKGKYKSVLDGNHRLAKAINNDVPTIPVRELDLREAPKDYKSLFNYNIEKDENV